jgi:general secretion pathway protein K
VRGRQLSPDFPPRQRGVALLVALLVVALAVILIAALLDRGELTLARTRNLLRAEQANAYALGLEQYAADVLLRAQAEAPGIDTQASPWALPLPPQAVPGGLISARLRDLNGCFNLNNLAPSNAHRDQAMKMFRALLGNRGVPESVADAVRAWLDGSNSGANAYLALPVPYRPRGDLFAHVSELRLVQAVNSDIYARLAPYVCALPPGTKINVNTASVPVLWSLSGSVAAITQPVAQKLWNNGQAHYGDLTAFARDAGVPLSALPQNLLGVESRYFSARADIVLDDIPLTFHSLIERGNAFGLRVLARSRGSDAMMDAGTSR